MQKTTIAGTVSSVRELKSVGDNQVFNFSVAVSNGKDKDGNWRDSTFWDCAVWGKRAESVSRFLSKGTMSLLNAGATGKDMVTWTKEPKLLPKCTIGKFRGKPWHEVEEGFLGWMLKQVDMDADLKWNAARELKRRTQ